MTGADLRVALEAMHWTPQQFARRFHLSRSTVNRWLRDRRTVPAWVPPVILMLADEELRITRATREAAPH